MNRHDADSSIDHNTVASPRPWSEVRREKPREETEARLLRERGTPEERIGPVVPDGTLYPQSESSAAREPLRAHIDAAHDRAQGESRAASTESLRRFWQGRVEALKDVRLWVAQELDRG